MQTITDEVAGNSLESLKEEFFRTGYAVARGLFSPAEVKELKDIFDVIADGGPLPGFDPVSEAEANGDPLGVPGDPLGVPGDARFLSMNLWRCRACITGSHRARAARRCTRIISICS